MAIRVRCQQCGKQSQFSESDAGMTALCVACGARFTIPSTSEPADASPPRPPILEFADALDADREAAARSAAAALSESIEPSPGAFVPPLPPAAAAATPPPPPLPTARGARVIEPVGDDLTPETPRSRMNHAAALYTFLGAILTAGIVLAVVLIVRAKPAWDEAERAGLIDLADRAQRLREQGNLADARIAYDRIEGIVAGRAPTDPKVAELLGRARAGREQLDKAAAAAAATRQVAMATSTAVGEAVGKSTGPAPAASTRPVPDDEEDDPQRNWPKYVPPPLPVNPNLGPRPANVVEVRPPAVETRPQTQPATRGAVASGATRPAGPPRLARAPITVGAPAPEPMAQGQVTDEQIGRSIQRAVDHLLAKFKDGQLVGGDDRTDAYYTGLNALVVYSLLQSSYAIRDERLNLKGPLVKLMIDKMKAMPADRGPVTYARGIRATALALVDRPQDKPDWQKDLAYLINSHVNGAYTYQGLRPMPVSPNQKMFRQWDNSNSQYGLLGVWSLAEIGAEVNSTYWRAVERHWTECQNDSGGWGYVSKGGLDRLSMTVAGVASLFVTHDWLDAPRIGAQVGREPFSKPLAKGLAFLETGDTAVQSFDGYTLYGVERAGLASGFKFFGEHDWYRELAARVVSYQVADGGWGNDVQTAYTLLFLARGRHPVLMNKLRYEGYWANRPRDVANLARFGSRELERPLNWQVVPLAREWTDWCDSPILYVSTHTAVKFTDAEVDKIRSFVNAGGLLFTQADGSRPEADASLRGLAKQLFPAYEMRDLPETHELFRVHYALESQPPLAGVSNGARLLIVHSATDLTQWWQMRAEKSKRDLFRLGMNLFLYASGKTDLRNRLSSPYLPAPARPARGGAIAVARVKYAGNWDPEPMAWTRLARYVQRATDVGVDVSSVELGRLDVGVAPFAHWTGTAAYAPTPAEIDAIRRYVEAGGVLLVDPCGGRGEFYETAKAAITAAFPKAVPQFVGRDHPMMTGAGRPGTQDLSTPALRAFARHSGQAGTGRLQFVDAGMGKVIFGPLDLTSGLLGTNTWGVVGYDPAYASALVKNILLWSATGMRED